MRWTTDIRGGAVIFTWKGTKPIMKIASIWSRLSCKVGRAGVAAILGIFPSAHRLSRSKTPLECRWRQNMKTALNSAG